MLKFLTINYDELLEKHIKSSGFNRLNIEKEK